MLVFGGGRPPLDTFGVGRHRVLGAIAIPAWRHERRRASDSPSPVEPAIAPIRPAMARAEAAEDRVFADQELDETTTGSAARPGVAAAGRAGARLLSGSEAAAADGPSQAPTHKVFAASTGIAGPAFAPLHILGLAAVGLGLAGIFLKAVVGIVPWWRRVIDELCGFDTSASFADEWRARTSAGALLDAEPPAESISLPDDLKNALQQILRSVERRA